jgi:hypothetical protein
MKPSLLLVVAGVCGLGVLCWCGLVRQPFWAFMSVPATWALTFAVIEVRERLAKRRTKEERVELPEMRWLKKSKEEVSRWN